MEHHPMHVSAGIGDGCFSLRRCKAFHTEQGDLWITGHREAATKGVGKRAKLRLVDHATTLAVSREVDVGTVVPAHKVLLILDECRNLHARFLNLCFAVTTNLTNGAAVLVSLVPDSPSAPRRRVDELDSCYVTVVIVLKE